MKTISVKRKIITALIVVFTFAVVLSYSFTIFPVALKAKGNSTTEEYLSTFEIKGDELASFAAKYDDIEMLTGTKAVSHNAKVDDIMSNSNLSTELKRQYLAELGVYEVGFEEKVELASDSSDVTLSKPTIYYDSLTKEYVITATGNWKKHTYEVPGYYWWYPSVGSTKNIGGTEAIGISLTNTAGSTDGLVINSGYGYFCNGPATKKATTLATENDNFGGGYKLQDFIKFTKVKNYIFWCDLTYYYNAYNMECVLRYNSCFKNYSGTAKLFYSHTWDDSSVTSIDLSTSGAGLGWSTNSDHWTFYSYGRTFAQGKSTN